MKYKYIQRTTVAGRVYLAGEKVRDELNEKELAKFLENGHIAERVETKPKKKAAKLKKKAAGEEVDDGNRQNAK